MFLLSSCSLCHRKFCAKNISNLLKKKVFLKVKKKNLE
jgi:hypothetical protein